LPVPHQILILTGAVIWTLVAVQCFECGILLAELLASASIMAAAL